MCVKSLKSCDRRTGKELFLFWVHTRQAKKFPKSARERIDLVVDRGTTASRYLLKRTRVELLLVQSGAAQTGRCHTHIQHAADSQLRREGLGSSRSALPPPRSFPVS